MRVARFYRHLVLPDWSVSRVFPKASLRAIEQAITALSSGIEESYVSWLNLASLCYHS